MSTPCHDGESLALMRHAIGDAACSGRANAYIKKAARATKRRQAMQTKTAQLNETMRGVWLEEADAFFVRIFRATTINPMATVKE